MGTETGIAWTDHTFNPWWGCEKVSPGCARCYAESLANMGKGSENGSRGERLFGTDQLWRGERRRTKTPWTDVLKWNRAAIAAGKRRRVFCASMADFFEDRPELTSWREEAWGLIRQCRALDWQLLTKRPENIAGMLPLDWGHGWPHVWLGTSCEDQRRPANACRFCAAFRPESVSSVMSRPLNTCISGRWRMAFIG